MSNGYTCSYLNQQVIIKNLLEKFEDKLIGGGGGLAPTPPLYVWELIGIP